MDLVGWFRDFIPSYSEKTFHLSNGLRGKDKIKVDGKMEKGFIEIKNELNRMGALKLPDYNKEFKLSTDASCVGLGAVLQQKDEKGN